MQLWHWLVYCRREARGKFLPQQQYDDDAGRELLSKERLLTTLGWLQAAVTQCLFVWLWGSGTVPLVDFHPGLEGDPLWVHRMEHAWGWALPVLGDVGRWLCKNFHRCALLCCAVLCCAVLCCAVLCCAVLCCAVVSHVAGWPRGAMHGSVLF
jgi:hypothetical protein